MRKWAMAILVFLSCAVAKAQVYITKTGTISFYSSTPLEDIKAENNNVYAAVDAGKKTMAFTLQMKEFVFPRKLMQEHFNENYIESDKYPKSVFTGTFIGDLNTSKDGTYTVTAKGQLGMHGVMRQVEVPAIIEIKGKQLTGKAKFTIKPDDYNIKIPTLVIQKIAKEIEVTVNIICTTK